jgi:peptide/nickel transport system substrate-binding protein
LTAADVKATYDKIVSPPEGVRSVRKNAYTAVARIETPDPSTVVFKLKFPSASLLDNLASPWNVIFPRNTWTRTRIISRPTSWVRPFKLKSYTRGSTFEGERNRDYFVKDRPYLDGTSSSSAPRRPFGAAAIRSGRAYIEFRDLPSAEVDAIRKQLGDKVAVQTTAVTGQWGIAINNTVEAVQRRPRPQGAHAGFDRTRGGKVLQTLTGSGTSAGDLMRPGSEWAMPDGRAAESFPVFWKDAEKSRTEEPSGSWPRPAIPTASRSS